MTKIRSFGFAFAAAAGIVIAGSGIAAAQEGGETPGTGSAESLPALIELLSTGSAGAGGGAEETATPIQDEEPGTGSAEGLPALIQALITGSAGTEAPAGGE